METVFPFCPVEPSVSETKNKPDYLLAGGAQPFILERFISVMVISFQNVSAVLTMSSAGWNRAAELCDTDISSSTVEAQRSRVCFFRNKKDERSLFPSERKKNW